MIEIFRRDNNLEDKIKITGFISHPKVYSYYKVADIFVTTSLTEVFPITLLEAMSFSLTIVCIDAIGTGDIVQQEFNGLLSQNTIEEFRKSFLRLIINKNLRKRLGENAAKDVQKYSIYKCVRSDLNLYRKLLDRY